MAAKNILKRFLFVLTSSATVMTLIACASPDPSTQLQSAIETYKKNPQKQKALALSSYPAGGWAAVGWIYGRSTLEEAKIIALQGCEERRLVNRTGLPCRIVFENNDFVDLVAPVRSPDVKQIPLSTPSFERPEPSNHIASTPPTQTPAVPVQKNLANDPERQDVTGYLQGQPQYATGGLSTFTVDNQRGDSDAVGRIYLNGRKPAVRSMYVKRGETFTAETIEQGNYVFRYRFIGSSETYESDRQFKLTQTDTGSGTRYSKVTVTLFRVKGGNMSSRKVNSDLF